MTKTLTATEQEVLTELASEWAGRDILPEHVYPCRNAEDNAKRRTIRRLAEKGQLEQPDRRFNIYRLAS